MRKKAVRIDWAHCRTAWLLAAAAVAGASGAASGQQILHGPIQNPTNGHWYGLLEPSGWNAARDASEVYGGHLATISSIEENEFIHNDLGVAFLVDGRLWIGLTDEAVEDNFVWVDGDPSTFRNWSTGEPNDSPPPEDWVEMHLSTGQWNDIAENPGTVHNGVIEFDEAVGACMTTGGCSIQTQAACAAMAGAYQGDFTACSGACCLPDATCATMSGPDCIAQSGLYQGDGTDCGSVVCPDLTGACCFPGFCFADIESICVSSGGVFRGVGTTCEEDCVPPANDFCSSAELIVSLPAAISGSTDLATLDSQPVCGDTSDLTAPGIWYRLPGTGHEITATLCSAADANASADYDAQISVFTDCGVLNCVAGSDDDTANGCFSSGGTATFCTDVGTDYLILVHGFDGATGSFTMAVTENTAVDCQTPANDLCTNAQSVSLPALVSGSTVAATTDTAPACPFAPSTGGVWYTVVGTGAEITATVCPAVDPNGQASADFDSEINVYTDCAALVCVAGNDDFCGLGSSVAFDSVAGQPYLILVHGVDTGSFNLAIFETPSGACCFNDGTCIENASVAECASMAGNFAGDGVTCAEAACVNQHADDTAVALDYNFNGIVHAPFTASEQADPDNPNGYRSISDRGLLIASGVAPNVAAAGAALPYTFVTTGFQLDIVHIGDRNTVDNGNHAFDVVVNGDDRGIQPAWLPDSNQATSSTTISPGIVMDAGSRVGLVYHASNGGAFFDVTLQFSDATSVTTTFEATDWFANGVDALGAPFPGALSQTTLAGPLSAGDGFAAASARDLGSTSASPLRIHEGVMSAADVLADLGFDMSGKTLTGITFGNRTNRGTSNSGVAIFGVTVDAGGVATPIDLNYNFNGVVHTPAPGGEQGIPDDPNGYRSISDRGLFFANNVQPPLHSSDLGYDMVETPFVLDIIYLGNRVFDATVDGDNIGILPNWLPGGGMVNSSSTTLTPGIGLAAESRLGVIYHATNGGATFDMTLGFSDSSSVVVQLGAPDWFANGTDVMPAPAAGVVSQALIPGPLSGGDGHPGAAGNDIGALEQPLNIVEAVATRAEILADLGVDVSGKTLTSITFDNRAGGSVAIFAMSVEGAGGAQCVCETDGNTAQVNVFDLLAYLDDWFAQAPAADIDGDPGVDVFDLLFYLDCWFPASAGAPCP